MASSYERFWARVDRTGGPGACWPWGGPVTAAGIGVFTVRGRRTTARRYAYLMQHGDPGPLRVVATCNGVLCVRFEHLTIATARAVALGNGSAAAINATRRCGHDRTDWYIHRDGRRECAECRTERQTPRVVRREPECDFPYTADGGWTVRISVERQHG